MGPASVSASVRVPRAGHSVQRLAAQRLSRPRRNEFRLVEPRIPQRRTLVISSQQFHLSAPTCIVTNERRPYAGLVVPDIEFMLEQAAKDRDRCAVYGAKIE